MVNLARPARLARHRHHAAVGRLVRAMVDETFACTTGAQVPIDGGNDRVI